MKTPVAITLILVGALLILAPAISDYLYQRNLVEIIGDSNSSRVSLDGEMSGFYRFVCWASGLSAILLGVISSAGGGKKDE